MPLSLSHSTPEQLCSPRAHRTVLVIRYNAWMRQTSASSIQHKPPPPLLVTGGPKCQHAATAAIMLSQENSINLDICKKLRKKTRVSTGIPPSMMSSIPGTTVRMIPPSVIVFPVPTLPMMRNRVPNPHSTRCVLKSFAWCAAL